MPYTPPSQHSPTSFFSNKDTSQRSHSPAAESFRFPPSPGPTSSLPRSSSSQRARRHSLTSANEGAVEHDNQARIEPANGHIMGLKVDTSANHDRPSALGSSKPNDTNVDKDGSQRSWNRNEGSRLSSAQLEELGDAVRQSITTNREGSPDPATENGETEQEISRESDDGHLAPPARKLSESARKISHSRSSTETSILNAPSSSSSPSGGSDSNGSDEDEPGLQMRPSMIRKKSGELVKPAIRPYVRRQVSSMPGTPTYGKKGVHFNDDIEQVRHFLQVDRPSAVSASGSPVENSDDAEFPFGSPKQLPPGLQLRLANFPRESHERDALPVRLDRLGLAADQRHLSGAVIVANLDFHKVVTARFTFDEWKTTSEVNAQYNSDVRQKPRDEAYDRFDFSIKLSDQANLEKKTLLLCVRYSVRNQEYWDNNGSANFKVDFVRRKASSGDAFQKKPADSPAIPRSRQFSFANSRSRSSPTLDDDFASGFDYGSNFRFKSKPPATKAALEAPSSPPKNTGSKPFGRRYDFGASLTAALSSAQDQLGDRSGVESGKAPAPGSGQEQRPRSARPDFNAPTSGSGYDSPRRDHLLANKQSVDSRAYQEFVSKFCFFGSGKPSAQNSNAQPSNSNNKNSSPKSGTDGGKDEPSNPTIHGKGPEVAPTAPRVAPNNPTSGLLAPPIPNSLPSPEHSGSSSPLPVTEPIFESQSSAPSSADYGYQPVQQNHLGGIFHPESPNLTAIQG
ncbi:MAG: hypothetical protein M1831_005088 [Alyxoria varia]|nr:MAG: hypothetical protein M1831_005088 [Alyxoria varia]